MTTHSIPAGPVCRPRWIDGMATLTMKKSRTIMKVPVSITASGAHVRWAGAGPVAARGGPLEILSVMRPPSAAGSGPVDYVTGNGLCYQR